MRSASIAVAGARALRVPHSTWYFVREDLKGAATHIEGAATVRSSDILGSDGCPTEANGVSEGGKSCLPPAGVFAFAI